MSHDVQTADDLVGAEPGVVTPQDELGCSIWTSPFTLPSTVIKNKHTEQRNWIWLAPTSAWSLTARLIVMMTEKLNVSPAINAPNFYLDGDIYPFTWNRSSASEPPDISGLPSMNYALYLFNIVKFHLGQICRFFDEESFISHMHKFYASSTPEEATKPRFWFVQFLLVLALGNAFWSRPRNLSGPPGSKFFARAMSVMPTGTSTGKDSLLAIETLALAGVYLYSIDHREAAHVHVGHAIRIAQLEGLHTQLPEEELGAATVARCRNLWWTLYIMDRHVSSSLGLPMTTQDSDITTLVNTPSASLHDIIFSLQIRLTQMLSYILNTIYKTEKTRLGRFLEITRNILQTMAKHAEEIEKMLHVNFQGSMDNVPQETRHIILLYHQCVIIATRPLLLSVLKERLEKLGRAEEEWQNSLALPKSLISIGIKSAVKMLQILSDENCHLEIFLPFDLEFTYASALHLTMANALFPPADDYTYSRTAHSILDEMIRGGNRVAEARKTELRCIEGLFEEFAQRIEQGGLRVLTLSGPGHADGGSGALDNANPNGNGTGNGEPPAQMSAAQQSSMNGTRSPSADPSTSVNVDSLDDVTGISSYEFLSIVDQIGNPEMLYNVLEVGPELWEDPFGS
ncbi:fungal-specific transcription factor domain-containing protein [Aspergillus floccosus]